MQMLMAGFRRFTVWALCAVIISWIFSSRSPRATYETIAREPRTAAARVLGKRPSDHRYIDYEFEAGGKTYRGKGYAGAGNPRFEDIQVGDSFIVTYFARNPEIAVAGNIEDRLFEASQGTTVIAVVVAMWVATMITLWLVKGGRL
ncbi:MAG: hypothetical protein IPK12_19665 [Gemmatimonadetes bacterium]|nr:hypothetical protein [Gemmatimonadota bacterium]